LAKSKALGKKAPAAMLVLHLGTKIIKSISLNELEYEIQLEIKLQDNRYYN